MVHVHLCEKYRKYFDVCSVDEVFHGCNWNLVLDFHQVAPLK